MIRFKAEKQQRGQTMIEILVVLTLIMLFLSGVTIVELYAIRNVEFSQNKSQATKLAQQQLERIRVIRDSSGMEPLAECMGSGCYIDSQIGVTPYLQITPRGQFTQKVVIQDGFQDCPPVPTLTIVPVPVSYKATAYVSWAQGTQITPPPEVNMSSCFTDWR